MTAVLSLGSNLGDRLEHLRAGLRVLGPVAVSSVWETAPVGGVDQGDFLNVVALVEIDATAAWERAQQAERQAQRVRDVRWGPRTLDIDVVLFGTRAVETPTLRVPHPELARRDFWQRELAELGVDWRAARDAAARPRAGTAA